MQVATDNLEKLVTRGGLYCVWELACDGETTRLAARWIDPSREEYDPPEHEEIIAGDDRVPLLVHIRARIQIHGSAAYAAPLPRRTGPSTVIFLNFPCGNETEWCNTLVKFPADTARSWGGNLLDELHAEARGSVNCATEMRRGARSSDEKF